ARSGSAVPRRTDQWHGPEGPRRDAGAGARPRAQQERQPDSVVASPARRRVHLRSRRRAGQRIGRDGRADRGAEAAARPRVRAAREDARRARSVHRTAEDRGPRLSRHRRGRHARVRARRRRRARDLRARRSGSRPGAAPAAERADARRRVREGGRGRLMPIHDQGYRRYAGGKVVGRGWTVIAAAGIRTVLAKRSFIGLILMAWFPFLVRAVQIYAAANVPQAAFLKPTPETFRQFLDQQQIFVFFVTVYIGAGLIANDRRANALQIYLSKPLTRGEYIFGKLAILMTFLLLV